MGADVYLLIIEPDAGAIAVERWIGRNATRDRVHEVLRRAPDHAAVGFASWGNVTPDQARRICDGETRYPESLEPAEVELFARELPDERFWWAIRIDD